MLPRQILGRTGLSVTRLGFGAMELRGPRIWNGRPVTPAEAERVLNSVLDAGINFIDTSPDYGTSEELIGRFISHRRNEFHLATKCGCQVVDAGDHDVTSHVWTREHLLRNIDESLRRMRTDYVDVLQLHNPTVDQVIQGRLVEVLQEIKAAGKTRWIGCSKVLPDQATFVQWGVFDVYQVPCSALERAHEKIISQAANSGGGTIIRGGVARGAPNEEGLGQADQWIAWEKARLDELLSPGESRTSFLFRFALSHPDAHTIIVGTMRPDHLEANVRAAMAGPLPDHVYAEAKRRLDAVIEPS